MIEFGCPHCGKRLVLPESYAGRDGWCRYCKGIIKMPPPGGVPSEPELPLTQKYARLERMFQYAAAVVDEHRQLQNKLQAENGAWAEENRIRVKAQLEVDRLQNALGAAESERDSANQVVDRLSAEVNTLRETNNRLESTRDDAETQRAELETKLFDTVAENDGLLERLLDAEQSIESQQTLTRESQEQWDAERESYENRLTALRKELSAAEDDSAAAQSRYESGAASEQQLRADLHAMVQASLAKQKELELALTEAHKERDAADEARQETASALADVSTQADRVPGLEEDLADRAARWAEADERCAALRRQVDELERAADVAAKRRAEAMAAWENQRRDLAGQLETLREARRASEEEISAVRAKSREAASNYQETIDGLQSELANETRRRAESENAAATARREVESTRSERDDLAAELDRLRENVRAKDARHETKIDGLRAELESARQQNRSLQGRIDEVTAEYERLLRSEPAQNPVNDDLAARVAELEEQLAEARAARSRAEARFVGAENRAAFNELDDVGYRSQFSSIAREFFEREVARQTDSQNGGDQTNGQETAESILDAVEKMRR